MAAQERICFQQNCVAASGHISIMPRTKVIDAATIHRNLRRHPEDEEQAAEKWKGLRNEEEKREVFLSRRVTNSLKGHQAKAQRES